MVAQSDKTKVGHGFKLDKPPTAAVTFVFFAASLFFDGFRGRIRRCETPFMDFLVNFWLSSRSMFWVGHFLNGLRGRAQRVIV
jgi:hypothetical protein